MLNIHRLPTCIITALILLGFSTMHGEPIHKTQIEPFALSMPDIVSDLKNRAKEISLELANSATESLEKPDETAAQKQVGMTKAYSEISQCLALRSLFFKHIVVPIDPFYRALRKQTLLNHELQAVFVWWNYCKAESQFRSLNSFNELPLTMKLKEEKEQADAELVALRSKSETAENSPADPSLGITLCPLISKRLSGSNKRAGSVLDRIADWDKLSKEERSKIIAH